VVENFKKLRVLNVSNNNISIFPDWIGTLTSLEELYFDADFFTKRILKLDVLPAAISQLQNLRILSLRDQVIHGLPDAFCTLKKLRQLDMRNNALEVLPDNFGDLSSLDSLDLKVNLLTKLPASFAQLKQLSCLDISLNETLNVDEVFLKLAQLNSLIYLDVSYTNFNDGQLNNLKASLPQTKIIAKTLDDLKFQPGK